MGSHCYSSPRIFLGSFSSHLAAPLQDIALMLSILGVRTMESRTQVLFYLTFWLVGQPFEYKALKVGRSQ